MGFSPPHTKDCVDNNNNTSTHIIIKAALIYYHHVNNDDTYLVHSYTSTAILLCVLSQEYFSEASAALFIATKYRAYLKNITVILPDDFPDVPGTVCISNIYRRN